MSVVTSSVSINFWTLEQKGAEISANGWYRYALYRRLDGRDPNSIARKACLFIMLNPSTADGKKDDPTIRRCIGFAKSWGCDELFVGNLFAWRATKPTDLKDHGIGGGDIVGPGNLDWVRAMADVVTNRAPAPGPIICAWGPPGTYMEQDQTLRGWLADYDLWCLGRAKHGAPRHPLMLKRDAALVPYR